jgi:hypothetical protein
MEGKMLKDYDTLKAGSWYPFMQMRDGIHVYGDDGTGLFVPNSKIHRWGRIRPKHVVHITPDEVFIAKRILKSYGIDLWR